MAQFMFCSICSGSTIYRHIHVERSLLICYINEFNSQIRNTYSINTFLECFNYYLSISCCYYNREFSEVRRIRISIIASNINIRSFDCDFNNKSIKTINDVILWMINIQKQISI